MENSKFICKHCGKKFNNARVLGGHSRGCELNPNKDKIFKKFECKFCNKIIKNSVSALKIHERACKHNPDNKDLYEPYEYHGVCEKCGKKFIKVIKTKKLFITEYKNRGKLPKFCSISCANGHVVSEKTKEKISNSVKKYNLNNPQIAKKSNEEKNIENYKKEKLNNKIKKVSDKINSSKILICKNCQKEFTYIHGVSFSRNHCSPKCKHEYLSKHTGGYRNGSGYGKSGWYKGIHCDSTWELAFVIYHLDNNLKIERCKEHRKYTFNGKEHIYIPDFVTNEGVIEIKGYKNDTWLEKEKQNPDVKVLYKEDMKFYLDYVVMYYGSDFVRLYDKSGGKYKSLDKKNEAWFHKINHENKTYINAFVTNKSEFQFYINNGWIINRTPIKIFSDYKNVRYKVEKRLLKKMRGKKEKEIYLSSLL